MRNRFLFPALVLACSLLFPGRAAAQLLAQDTAAVRVILSENQLDLPVSQVIEIADGRVVSLILENRQLVRMPPHIGALTALRTLSLAGNLLDSLPGETWNLANLSQLDLGGNRLRGIDGRVGRLQNLLFLGLRDNQLANLPHEVFSLVQVEILILSGNALDTLPEAVAELPFLRYLDLSGNRLRSLPWVIGALDLLDSLDVRLNLLETLPDAIRALRPETVIHLGGNQLCALPPDLDDWANRADPDWRAAQHCGSSVRRSLPYRRGGRLRLERAGGGFLLRLDRPVDLAGRALSFPVRAP